MPRRRALLALTGLLAFLALGSAAIADPTGAVSGQGTLVVEGTTHVLGQGHGSVSVASSHCLFVLVDAQVLQSCESGGQADDSCSLTVKDGSFDLVNGGDAIVGLAKPGSSYGVACSAGATVTVSGNVVAYPSDFSRLTLDGRFDYRFFTGKNKCNPKGLVRGSFDSDKRSSSQLSHELVFSHSGACLSRHVLAVQP